MKKGSRRRRSRKRRSRSRKGKIRNGHRSGKRNGKSGEWSNLSFGSWCDRQRWSFQLIESRVIIGGT